MAGGRWKATSPDLLVCVCVGCVGANNINFSPINPICGIPCDTIFFCMFNKVKCPASRSAWQTFDCTSVQIECTKSGERSRRQAESRHDELAGKSLAMATTDNLGLITRVNTELTEPIPYPSRPVACRVPPAIFRFSTSRRESYERRPGQSNQATRQTSSRAAKQLRWRRQIGVMKMFSKYLLWGRRECAQKYAS